MVGGGREWSVVTSVKRMLMYLTLNGSDNCTRLHRALVMAIPCYGAA